MTNTQLQNPTGATVAEAEAFLQKHPEIEAFDIVLHDSNGVGRGKIIRRNELIPFYTSGRHMPVSVMGLDICGEDVDETGLVWDQGDNDLKAWPIAGSIIPLHNTTPPRGEILMSMYDLDGKQMGSDPRHALQRQIDKLAGMGLHPAGAFELEFFLLDNERDDAGNFRPAAAVLDGRRSRRTEVYSVDHLHGMMPLFSDIYKAAELAQIDAETVISEYAPGQYELTLNYRKDVMQAADDLIRMKRIVRAQARHHGVTACFMAKPFANYAGSGMHFHCSMLDDDGKNIFAEQVEGEWKPELLHALAGLQKVMPETMLTFAPHLNSWRRFAQKSYAPISTTWGVNNRSVALRVPAGEIKARRIEHRLSGVDANPYLVATSILAGMIHGLKSKEMPSAEVRGNGYEIEPDPRMPVDWHHAIEMARNSEFLKNALGEQLHNTFVSVKEAEYFRVQSTISEIDFDLYLHNV